MKYLIWHCPYCNAWAPHRIMRSREDAMGVAALAAHKPREKAGSVAFRAFDFQVHYSMSKVLSIYSEDLDFSAFFDHFDDLVVVVESSFATEISFYQIKTKIGSAWTVKQLASRPKAGELPKSIIGKSYYNINQFGVDIRRSAIISNQPLNGTYADGTKIKSDDGEIVFGNICKEDFSALSIALNADFPCGVHGAHTTLLTYERTPLDPQSFRMTLLGEVTEFVEKIDPSGAAAAKPVYDALLSEISRCTGDTHRPATLSELKARKSMTRADVDALVERVQQRTRTVLEWWDAVAAEMSAAGEGAIKQHKLRLSCLSYWRERQRGSIETLALSDVITQCLDTYGYLINDSILGSAFSIRMALALEGPKSISYSLESAIIVEIMGRI